jgi:hypothetical protein
MFSSLSIPEFLLKKFPSPKKEIPEGIMNRRAQSMSILPSMKSQCNSSPEDLEFALFEQEAGQFEAHRQGLLLAKEQAIISRDTITESSANRYPGLGVHAPVKPYTNLERTQPRHPVRSRRVQSAPSIALTQLSSKLLDDLDQWEDDFTLNEWVVPKVREKAERQQQPVQHIEEWDADFDDENEPVEIPLHVQEIQEKFKVDMLHMRKFALHIQGKTTNSS